MKINKKQIQKEICNAMLDGNSRLIGAEIENNAIAVTVDGFVAYILQKNECIFDISKIRAISDRASFLEVFKENEKDKLLTITPLEAVLSSFGELKTIRRLTCEDFDCFVDVRLLKRLKGGKFYGYGSLNRILVKDDFDCPIGVVMPTRYELKY